MPKTNEEEKAKKKVTPALYLSSVLDLIVTPPASMPRITDMPEAASIRLKS